MRVYVHGTAVNLSKADYVGGGGEGNVYVKGTTAYKIYHDRTKMLAVGKIRELQALTDPDIIKPERVVNDKQGTPLGYTMRFLPDTHTLCELFPPVFRQRNNVSPQMTLDLVRSLQERVGNTHKAGILAVDLNEMNFLVDPAFQTVYAIDVDSYQTPHYPATVIMASIRDPQVSNLDWTELSDWFSFACVTFNLFTGIHPYKGKHPSIKGMEHRMAAGVSVFNTSVRVPRVVLPFDVIPPVYRQWYEAVLERGQRLPPPQSLQGTLVVLPTVRLIKGTNKLDISKLLEFEGAVRGMWDHRGDLLVWTDEGIYHGKRRLHGPVHGISGVGFTPRMGRPIVAGSSQGMLKLLDVSSGLPIPVILRADAVMAHGGRIYVRNQDQILQIMLNDVGSRVLASSLPVTTCLEHATKLYQGIVVQDLLGSKWVSLLPETGMAHQLHIQELDDYRILDAKFDNTPTAGVLMVVGSKNGKYGRLVLRFSSDYKSYDVRVIEDVNLSGLNFVLLDSGVCICMTEDEKLELFSARKGSPALKVVDDPVLGGDMHLTQQGGRVVFPRGKDVFSLRMK